jgi:hypothetical protein
MKKLLKKRKLKKMKQWTKKMKKLMIQMIFEYAVQNICFSYAIYYA